MTKKNKYNTKKYLHFDNRIGYKSVESYVTDPLKISRHGFFPMIHYTIDFETYNEDFIDERDDKRPIKEKTRDIMYASHLDNFIYKYYGDCLNRKYNEWAKSHSIDECSIAYRDNKYKKSNIDFSAEVINIISNLNNCFIMVGDFEKFFDRLDHYYLKERLMDILEIKRLPQDWYKVFKSITKFSYIEKDFLNSKLGTDREIKAQGQLKYFETIQDFRDFREKFKCVKNNTNEFGIPQGSAISAVLANVYTTIFDKEIETLAAKYNGLYRRYSDDFILIIPRFVGELTIDKKKFMEIVDKVNLQIRKSKLYIQEDKTQLYEYKDFNIINLHGDTISQIDYLGFVFDGKTVKMRSKSPYKFYRKAYKLIDRAKKIKNKYNRMPYRKGIYQLYTDIGINSGDYGNFISYTIRAQIIFDRISPNTNNIMMQQIKNRKKKIERRMGYKLSIKEYKS